MREAHTTARATADIKPLTDLCERALGVCDVVFMERHEPLYLLQRHAYLHIMAANRCKHPDSGSASPAAQIGGPPTTRPWRPPSEALSKECRRHATAIPRPHSYGSTADHRWTEPIQYSTNCAGSRRTYSLTSFCRYSMSSRGTNHICRLEHVSACLAAGSSAYFSALLRALGYKYYLGRGGLAAARGPADPHPCQPTSS